MALHFTLAVNGAPIGRFVATRREAQIPADGVCTYDVQVRTYAEGLRTVSAEAVVRHRYDDGAWQLVRAALGAVLEVEGVECGHV